MAHGQNAAQKQAKLKELPNKRCKKAADRPTNKFSKRVTHKHERRQGKILVRKLESERD